MEEKKPLPPRNEWKDLGVNQLYDLKTDMLNMYYNMRAAGASFAGQYSKFIGEIDALIQRKQSEVEKDQY